MHYKRHGGVYHFLAWNNSSKLSNSRWHCYACHGVNSLFSTPPSALCLFMWPLSWQQPACTLHRCQQSVWWPSWTTSVFSKSRLRSLKPCRLTQLNTPASSPLFSSHLVSLTLKQDANCRWKIIKVKKKRLISFKSDNTLHNVTYIPFMLLYYIGDQLIEK